MIGDGVPKQNTWWPAPTMKVPPAHHIESAMRFGVHLKGIVTIKYMDKMELLHFVRSMLPRIIHAGSWSKYVIRCWQSITILWQNPTARIDDSWWPPVPDGDMPVPVDVQSRSRIFQSSPEAPEVGMKDWLYSSPEANSDSLESHIMRVSVPFSKETTKVQLILSLKDDEVTPRRTNGGFLCRTASC